MSRHLKPAAQGKGRLTMLKPKSTTAPNISFTAEYRDENAIHGVWSESGDSVLTAPPEERANQIVPFPKPTGSAMQSARNPRGLQLCPSDVSLTDWTCIAPSLEVSVTSRCVQCLQCFTISSRNHTSLHLRQQQVKNSFHSQSRPFRLTATRSSF